MAPQQAVRTVKLCPRCGKPIAEQDMSLCPSCGSTVDLKATLEIKTLKDSMETLEEEKKIVWVRARLLTVPGQVFCLQVGYEVV
jgi:uncharacterized membrane protein YvbJ